MNSRINHEMLKTNQAFWRNPIIVIFSSVLLFFATQIISSSILFSLSNYIVGDTARLLIFIAINIFVLFGLLSTAKKITGFSWQSLGLRRASVKSMLIVIPAFVIYLAASLSLTVVAQLLISGFDINQTQNIGFSRSGGSIELIAAFIGLVVLTPIFEELIFRGVLFQGLRRRLPFWWSAIITSVIFAVAHGQWNVAVDTFALSFILCFLVERSNSILPAIFLHALKNSLAFTLLFIVKVG